MTADNSSGNLVTSITSAVNKAIAASRTLATRRTYRNICATTGGSCLSIAIQPVDDRRARGLTQWTLAYGNPSNNDYWMVSWVPHPHPSAGKPTAMRPLADGSLPSQASDAIMGSIRSILPR